MGMQDRDYYKEWWKKRTGYTERTSFRLPAYSSDDDDGGAYLSRPQKKPVSRLRQFWLTLKICAFVYLALKLVAWLSSRT